MQVVGLFAGIGGLELGLSKSGHHSRLLCELDDNAGFVLKQKFKDFEFVKDICELRKLPSGQKIICAGFPCQDLSSSGVKGGINGSQSSLVDELFRLIRKDDEIEWLIIENVKFMLHLGKGRAMQHITHTLSELDFKWAYRLLNTEAFGIPQRRHRVYFVASRNHDPRDVLLSDDFGRSTNIYTAEDKVPTAFYWTEGRYATGLAYNSTPPIKGGSTIGIPSPPAILFENGTVGTPNLSDAERLQGFPKDWTKVVEKISRSSMRWKLIGNAVSVPIPTWLGKKLSDPTPYDASLDLPMRDGKWPNAGWSVGDDAHASDCSEWPIRKKFVGLDEFLKFDVKPLSAKATKGYIKRAKLGNLRHPFGFLDKLERHFEKMSKK